MTLQIDMSLTRKTGFTLAGKLSLDASGFIALFGPSGCGKTTFLRCVAGLEPSAQGAVRIGEDTWQDTAKGVFIPPHKRQLGYVFQEAALFSHMTVKQNIMYGATRTPDSEMKLRLDDVCDLTGCGPLLERSVANLSGGEKQRVGIARALLPGPSLLLMDEPLASLDNPSREQILPLLKQLHKQLQIPVLYVTHNASELALLADRVALFETGRIVAEGDVFSMLARVDLAKKQGKDPLSAIEADIEGYDTKNSLTRLAWKGGELLLPMEKAPQNGHTRVIIYATDVSLTRYKPEKSSILNVFPVTVESVSENGSPFAMVKLDAQGVPLLSCITKYSAGRLNIRCGNQLFAQIKSAALEE